MVEQAIPKRPLMSSTPIQRHVVINPTRMVFYTLFLAAFLLSGMITMLGVIPYRMGVMSLLALPLIVIYGPKLDTIILVYALLAFVVVLSGLVNRSSLSDILLFVRILLFSYLTYYVVERFINQRNIERIIRLCVGIGLIQLPVVASQLLTYDLLPQRVKSAVTPVDYDFGTFNFKGDGAMSFFLILLVVFLLFEHKRNYVVRHRRWVVMWLSATVLITNSEMAKVLLIVIWLIYFITHLTRKTTILLLFSAILTLGVMSATGIMGDSAQKLQRVYDNVTRGLRGDPQAVTTYLEGGYSRGGAIYYYLNSELLLLGDGPNRYSNPFTRERVRGNVGHIFTFYSEVGLLGWMLSIVIFFLIIFKPRRGFIRWNIYTLLVFFCVLVIMFTHQVMNDVSVVMITCIMARIFLIPPLGDRYSLARSNFNARTLHVL